MNSNNKEYLIKGSDYKAKEGEKAAAIKFRAACEIAAEIADHKERELDDPLFYKPVTELGKKLEKIRAKAIASGTELLNIDEINRSTNRG